MRTRAERPQAQARFPNCFPVPRCGSDANSLYTAACFRAVTAAALRAADKSPAGAKQAEAEAGRAMAWLERAVAAGYHDTAAMAADHELDALRHRADFKELLARLSAAPAVVTKEVPGRASGR